MRGADAGETGRSQSRTPATTSVITIGRYTVFGELAAGGMATVHLGRLIGAGGFSRVVAIKRLHPQFARDPDFVEMLLDEARIAACIAHPNVVPTLDVIAEDREVVLVMEYVRGVSLAQVLRALRPTAERMPLPVAMGIMTGLLRGLHAAHEASDDRGAPLNIVHRDVSPQNVLIGIDGVPRVVDFGVAKAAGRLHTTQDGRIKGKIAYMAPEQLCQGTITRRTDIYAAAIVMWEVVTGQRLFGNDTGEGMLSRVLAADAPPPSSVVGALPSAVDEIVARGLERDASGRFETAGEMADAIERRLDVAGAKEIATWLQSAAAGPLKTHADRVAAIERERLVEAGGAIARESATSRESEVAAEVPTLGASVTGTQTSQPLRRRDRVAMLAGVVALCFAVAAGFALRRGGRAEVAAPETPSMNAMPAAQMQTTTIATTSGPEASPSATASAPATPAPSSRGVGTAQVGRPRRPMPSPAASGKKCAPYTIDSEGHKVFNAACL